MVCLYKDGSLIGRTFFLKVDYQNTKWLAHHVLSGTERIFYINYIHVGLPLGCSTDTVKEKRHRKCIL